MAIEQPQAWPAMLGHLKPEVPMLQRVICWRAMHDVGICEVPPGSNRSGRIDAYNKRSGAPDGSYWCASWATAVWVDAGADVPPFSRASCDQIVTWAMENGLWIPFHSGKPEPGFFVLYTTSKALPSGNLDANHIGIEMRTDPYQVSCEGNAAFSGHSRNGEAVLIKRVDTSRVYGYVRPQPRKAT